MQLVAFFKMKKLFKSTIEKTKFRRVNFAILFISSCLLASCSLFKTKFTTKQIERSLKENVVKVECFDYRKQRVLGQGSGFFIDDSGTFITNFHVIDNSYQIKITTFNGTEKWVDNINTFKNDDSDFAICSVKNLASKKVIFSDKINVDDKVFTLSYPTNSDSAVSTVGAIKNTNLVFENKKYIENTAEIQPGSSGGILCNKRGEVLGIATCKFEGSDTYGAIPYDAFKDYLEINNVNKEPSSYFHEVQQIELDSSNAAKYFDWSTKTTKESNGSYKLDYTIQLKRNHFTRICIDDSFITVTINFSCYFFYYPTATSTETVKVYKTVSSSQYIYDADIEKPANGTAYLSCDSDYVTGDTGITVSYKGTTGSFHYLVS